jgi:hypothetical protein
MAVDGGAHAPATQVAHWHHVVPMTDAAALRARVPREVPDVIVPEIERIAADEPVRVEEEGWPIIPRADIVVRKAGVRTSASAPAAGSPSGGIASWIPSHCGPTPARRVPSSAGRLRPLAFGSTHGDHHRRGALPSFRDPPQRLLYLEKMRPRARDGPNGCDPFGIEPERGSDRHRLEHRPAEGLEHANDLGERPPLERVLLLRPLLHPGERFALDAR